MRVSGCPRYQWTLLGECFHNLKVRLEISGANHSDCVLFRFFDSLRRNAFINTELGAQLVRPPMTVRSVGMVDPAQYKNGAFDSGQWVQSFSNIFPYDERGSALNENTMMSTYRLHASPRPHRVVSQTSGVVPPTHRTLRRRGGTQTARQKQKN